MVVSPALPTPPQALFVSYAAALGGAERILLDQAAALEGPVTLACPEGELAARARQQGVHVAALRPRRAELRGSVRHRLAAPLRLAAQSREVRNVVDQLQPRCVIGWSMRGLLAAAGALAGRGSRPPLIFQHNDLLPSPGVARAVRVAAARAERVVCLSRAIADDLGAGLPADVVHPGVDLERFEPSPLPTGAPEALVLGAIVNWKRPGLALEAAAIASRELPDLRIRLAGAPLDFAGSELARTLARRAAEPDLAGRARLGEALDASDALARSTCLLHCADAEPFGLAMAEALSSGRPVAAPRAGGALEIVDHTCGVLYEPGSATAAAAALVEVTRRAPDLAGPARERAEWLFDRRVSQRRFRDLVDEVTGAG